MVEANTGCNVLSHHQLPLTLTHRAFKPPEPLFFTHHVKPTLFSSSHLHLHLRQIFASSAEKILIKSSLPHVVLSCGFHQCPRVPVSKTWLKPLQLTCGENLLHFSANHNVNKGPVVNTVLSMREGAP